MRYRDSDYFLSGGRIIRHTVCRATNGRPRPDPKFGVWLATLRDQSGGQFDVKNCSSSTTEQQLQKIILLQRGIWDVVKKPVDVSPKIPVALVSKFLEKVNSAAALTAMQYKQLGHEPAMTGAFFSGLAGTYEADDWKLDVDYQNFSPIVKEPVLGADTAVVIDIADANSRRVVKSIWFQAKRVDNLSKDPWALQELRNQMDTMSRHTTAGHALLFSPAGLVSASTSEIKKPHTIKRVLGEALTCIRGDRSASAVANSFGMRTVVELIVSPPSPHRVPRNRMVRTNRH